MWEGTERIGEMVPGRIRPSMDRWHRLYLRPDPHQHASFNCGGDSGARTRPPRRTSPAARFTSSGYPPSVPGHSRSDDPSSLKTLLTRKSGRGQRVERESVTGRSRKPNSRTAVPSPADLLDSGHSSGTSTGHLAGHRTISAVRIPELTVGLFIVAASIGGAVFWQRSVESGTAVLVTSRDVDRGDVLTENDISEVIVKTTGDIALIRSSATPQVVGRRVTADLSRGTPLTPGFLSQFVGIGPLDGLVGLTVRLSSAPVELAAGDVVRVFTIDSTLEGELTVDEVPGPLFVWDVSTPDPLSSERAVTVKSPLQSIPRLVGREEIHLVKVMG